MLQVNGITVVYGGVTAVKDVSFNVKDGEILGLIGPNGAGKTTLMRVITGTVKPTEGSIFLEETCLDDKPPYKRIRLGIGLSQQIVHPFKSMSVLDNVAFVAGYMKTKYPTISIFRRSRAREREKAKEIMRILGIEDVAEQKPENLPLGYLKRLEVARAKALNPKILLLDEPLAGLNQLEAQELADKLLELKHLGHSILLIEHNLSEVIRICDRLVVIDNGIKIGEGEPQSVMNNPVIRNAYLGEEHHAAS